MWVQGVITIGNWQSLSPYGPTLKLATSESLQLLISEYKSQQSSFLPLDAYSLRLLPTETSYQDQTTHFPLLCMINTLKFQVAEVVGAALQETAKQLSVCKLRTNSSLSLYSQVKFLHMCICFCSVTKTAKSTEWKVKLETGRFIADDFVSKKSFIVVNKMFI